MSEGIRDYPRQLVNLLIAGVVVRLALWFWFIPLVPHINDEMAHVELARNLATTGEYAFSPGKPTSLRPPLYPAMIAGIFSMAGMDNYPAVRLLQAAISLFTVILMYRLGRELYSEKVGLRAAAIFCFYPSFLGFNNLMLTEVPFTFFLVCGVLSLACGLNRTSLTWLCVAGIVLGLGALTRSILYPFAPILGVYLLLAWRGSIPQRVLASLVFLLPFALVLTPWTVRNTQLQQTLITVDCMGGRNFMMGNYEYTPLYRSWDAISITGDREWIKILNDHHPDMKNMTQGMVDKLAGKQAVHFISENPGLTLKRDIIKFSDFWGLERELFAGADRGYFGPINQALILPLGILICASYALVLFSGVFGSCLQPIKDRRIQLLILLVIAFHAAVHTVVFAHSRYHLPVMPFVGIFAASAFSGPSIWTQTRRVGFWVALGVCLLIMAGWVHGFLSGDLDKVRSVLGFI